MKDKIKLFLTILSWGFGILFLLFSMLLSFNESYYVAALFIFFSLLTIPKTRPPVIKLMTIIKNSPPIKIIASLKIQYIAIPIAVLAIVMIVGHQQNKNIDEFVKNKSGIIESIEKHYKNNELELAKNQINIYRDAISIDSDLMNLSQKVENKINENSILKKIANTNQYDFNRLSLLYDNLVKLQPKNNEYKSKYDYYNKYKNSLIISGSEKWSTIVDNLKQKECKDETIIYNEAHAGLNDWYVQATNENNRIIKDAEAVGAHDVADEYKRNNTEAWRELSARMKPYTESLSDCINKNIKNLGYIVIPS